MHLRRQLLSIVLFVSACCWLGQTAAQAPAAPLGGQQADSQAVPTAPGVIRAETNLVLVDVIAMDKKGNYVRDLEAKEFHVLEDDKEQTISSFSRVSESGGAQGPAQPRYLVLFFDNSTMPPGEQTRARQAAAQFIEKTASKDRLLAVADFSGAFRVTQNFTANTEALRRAVGGVKFASLQPNEPGQTTELATLGAPTMLQVRSDFAARSVLLAIRNLAKMLRAVPGRKTVILFSGGFPLTPERESELTATIDAANKANVAIYTVDVRGLTGLTPGPTPDITEPARQPGFPGMPPGASLDQSAFPHETGLWASGLGGLFLPKPLAQRPQPGGGGGAPGGGGGGAPGGGGGGAPGGGGSTAGGGTGGAGGGAGGSRGGGTTPGTGGTTPAGSRGGGGRTSPTGESPYSYERRGYESYPTRTIIPPLLDNIASKQQVLHALATDTGGFTIFNTNDFLEGLNKIRQELQEYYVLAYLSPNQAHDGSYHRIQVKVDRKGIKIRSRNGYYDLKGPDILAGKPEGKILEEQAASSQPGEIPVALNAPYFYAGANLARVNLALEIPAQALSFEKEKGKFHSVVHVLGIAYREDGMVAARFSDTATLDLEKKDMKELTKGSFPYRNTFNIVPGKYTLKVVLRAGGQKFGKYEIPLNIEPFDGKQFHMSGVALSNKLQPLSQLTASLDAALLEERTPLVAGGIEVTPSANNRFKRDEKVALYVEVYEPVLLTGEVPRVGIMYNLIDRKTNQQIATSNTIPLDPYIEPGNPVIPVGWFLPVDRWQPGSYRLDVRARDALGRASAVHSVEFALD